MILFASFNGEPSACRAGAKPPFQRNDEPSCY